MEISTQSIPLFVSGYGQYHTDNPTSKNPKSYLRIDLTGIRRLADNPQQVDKTQAQWLIASTLPSRVFKEQQKNGEYWMLWADIDKNPPEVNRLEKHIKLIISDHDFEVYTTSSATKQNQKARIIIPLTESLDFEEWRFYQELLNDLLVRQGVTPDRSTERAAQLCYLPNRGEFYAKLSSRNDKMFDPLTQWANDIKTKRKAIKAEADELEKQKKLAATKREALSLSDASDNTIDAFNQTYTVQEILIQAGYRQCGSSFRHPFSESGSYSANVKDGRVHSLSTSDPLYTDGKGAHDAFSAFTALFHNNDGNEALKDAGNKWLKLDGESWNKVKQREYAIKKDLADLPNLDKSEFCSLDKFSLNGSSEKMRDQMLSDTYVLDKIAILGQATVIYAKPNTGKTLLVIWLLIESIKTGEINGNDVYYINADDNFKGLVHKVKLAEEHGFQMLAPGHNGFNSGSLLSHMKQMINESSASGKVIILDTLKKFTDLMDKKMSSDFMCVGREFIAKGGTLILLAHTNKRRDKDNKLIVGGTSDIVDDVDCAFTLDEVDVSNDNKKVLFNNIKSRGDVAREIVYSYSIKEAQSYNELLETVCALDDEEIEQAKKQKKIDERLQKNNDAINSITEVIEQGHELKTELIEAAHKNSGISKRNLAKVLDEHTGNSYLAGDRWSLEKSEKNSKRYHLLSKLKSKK